MGVKAGGPSGSSEKPTSRWSLQIAARPSEGRGGGVYVEEVLYHARSEHGTQ